MDYRPRVAFIIQRYGAEVVGGAEALCRAVARRLTRRWAVEILTTCAVDHMTWANELPAGTSEIEGVTVRRFLVDRPRNVRRFNRHNERVLMRFHSIEDEQEWMALQGPHSSGLLAFLAANRADYDGFVLFTYLYATSYDTLEHVRGKFYLVPFAHDEPPIYLRLFEDVFRAARGIVFCTEEERNFVQQRFPFALPRGEVLGMGVDLPAGADGERFRSRFDMREPFMLYAGRIAESKSCRDLFGCYSAYRAHAGSSDQTLSLALCGSAQMRVPRLRGIRYLGVISEQEKWDAMAAARFLVLPSRFESLSIVLLEAWATGTPALVNGTCLVSVGQCRRSQAGLWYRNADEFSLVADWLARDDGLCRRLGANGLDFVRSSYQWPKIVERYMEFIRFEALAIV